MRYLMWCEKKSDRKSKSERANGWAEKKELITKYFSQTASGYVQLMNDAQKLDNRKVKFNFALTIIFGRSYNLIEVDCKWLYNPVHIQLIPNDGWLVINGVVVATTIIMRKRRDVKLCHTNRLDWYGSNKNDLNNFFHPNVNNW